jgi:hypothetical protein
MSYRWHDEPVVRPGIWVVPSGPVEVGPAGRGWTLRRRGDSEGTVVHSYRCPVHGVFDRHVSREDVPDSVACEARLGCHCGQSDCKTYGCYDRCREDSPWAGSLCGIGWAAGEVTG